MLHFGNGSFLNEYIAVYQKHNTQRTITQAAKFPDRLIEMVLSCKNDEFYNKQYNPSESEIDRLKTFIRLFYLQYENREDARIYAEEISKKANADNRIQNLSNQILCDAKSDPEFKDNMIKNSIRILKRIISKYIFNNKAQTDQLIKFSDKINSDWWNEY
jgi:hypothetical protein